MIHLTLKELRDLLDAQKELVIDKLRVSTAYYNRESTEGHLKSIDSIDREKFVNIGREAKYPNDYNILVKYLKDE
jgi:hypothetical protein